MENALYDELLKIIKNCDIKTVFQPIVSLIDGKIIGYEALSRGPQGSPLESPAALFSAAEEFHMVWDVELMCRGKALERARDILQEYLLFINVDPMIIKDEKFREGFTRDFLAEYNINPKNIIFEITEKTAITDYLGFRKVIDHYIRQGYKIAIDDTGAGYSGLRTVAETCPQYIKIDMELIRNIDSDYIKQAILKTFHSFSWMTNMKIIAEGIETEAELKTLIDLGIYYGQGYFLQRPSQGFLTVSPEAIKVILEKHRQKNNLAYRKQSTLPIGEISKWERPIHPDMSGKDVDRVFKNNPLIQGLVVVDEMKTVGLVMRNKFYFHLAGQYGVNVFMGRPIKILMDNNPLVVEYGYPLDRVSRMSLARQGDQLYDYIVVTNEDRYYGVVTIRDLLEKTTQLELNIARHANPLTGLPGNLIIEERIKDAIQNERPFALVYVDLDFFKEYNDVYGFENGDNVLKMTAELLKRHLNSCPDSFLGHIGGDDFVALTSDNEVEELCQEVILSFDRLKYSFYTECDQKRGYILTKNRHGRQEKFSLLTISLAVVTNRENKFSSAQLISETASAIKKRCKEKPGSCWIVI